MLRRRGSVLEGYANVELDPVSHPDPDVIGCIAHMAPQSQLGLRSDRRAWAAGINPAGIAFDEKNLISPCGGSVNRALEWQASDYLRPMLIGRQ